MDGSTLFLDFFLNSVKCFRVIGIDFESGFFEWGETDRLRRVDDLVGADGRPN